MKLDELTMPFNELPIDLHNLYPMLDYHPLIVSPDSYVIDAVSLMNQPRSYGLPQAELDSSENFSNWSLQENSCVLVVEAGNLLGIFTERDLVKLTVAQVDLSALKMAEVMTQPVITMKISRFQGIFAILSLLRQHQIRHLPIVDEQEQLLGIVTATSLMQGFELTHKVGIFAALERLQDDFWQVSQQINGLSGSDHCQGKCENHREKLVSHELFQQAVNEHHRTQLALKQSEKLYRQLVENQTDVIIRIDDLGQIQFVNPAAAEVFGQKLEELRDKSLFDFFPVEELPQAIANLKALTTPPYSLTISEQPILTAKGVRWFQWNTTGVKNENGEVREFQGVGRDITERKQAEQSLKESQERLSLAMECANMGIWDWNCLTNKTVWSDNMGPLYGLPSGTLCPNFEEYIKLVHPEDRKLVTQVIAGTRRNAVGQKLDFRVVWPDGSIHWLTGKTQVYENKQGQPIRIIGTIRDISEQQAALRDRKQAEAALRESEQLYRSVVTVMREGILLQQANGQIIACNTSAENILGLSKEQLMERTCIDERWRTIREDGSLFSREQHPAMVTLRTGEPCTDVIMGVYKTNGQLIWLTINSQPLLRDNETIPYAVVTSFSDISDAVAAAAQRQQREQKIREQAALLDVATDAIFVRNLDKAIVFWNQGAENTYGWSQSAAMGKNPQELLCAKNAYHLDEQALKTVVETGGWQGELPKVTKSGKEIIVESRWTLLRDAHGAAKSILVVDTDITQKKQLEEQFFRAQRLESLGTLAGGIAHDLNNILTPILAAAQILKVSTNQNKERSPHLLEIIESNAKRGASLVKQVLSFARGFKGERTIIQLKHLITDIVLIGQQTFPKDITFTTSSPEELWTVCGDVTQMHQVLMNLVVNARDAMPDGGHIHIVADNIFIDEAYARMNLEAKVGHYIKISVSDTGVGMTPEVLNKIFEPFFTTKDITTGTGLGLSTVMGIIKSHGGFVDVISQVDQGSTFYLFLPAVPGMPDIPVSETETPKGNGELILVVDDEAPICEITKLILENHDYKTLIATNGIEAIALYAQHKHHISAVFMDMMMPEMDGATAIRTLQKMNADVQIIACSGINCTEALTQATGVGVQQVLPKPFTAKELLNTLHDTLKSQN
ncbi:PAS domain S-box protein [Nostoc sp. TCL26-01]|uniref:PAS domain S-box protein n=1 Tax=Nostoc sp. TCL26-01 TaxID=2576904 RepID=UPI0015B9D0D5|nr:PAS domain S-box protein [Nostoc sp. TCL26-01]QLE58832.1 PAS domain S-box protein [Nostoc sp. TCL26-01]